MIISPSSLVATLLTSTIIALIAMVLVKLISYNKVTSSRFLMMISIVFMIRLMFPFEFFFTRTLPSHKILPAMSIILEGNVYRIGSFNFRLFELLSIIWVLGSLFFGYKFVDRMRKVSSLKKLTESKQSLLFSPNHVVFINKPISPCVIGLFNPTIVLPNIHLTESETELILKHEFIHISSFDLFIKYLYELISVVYWWNPLVHLFRKHLDLIIELKVDDQVIRDLSMERKLEYIQALIKLGKFINTSQKDTDGFVTRFVGTNQSCLLLRSRNILNTTKKEPPILSILFVGLFCFILSSCIVFEPFYIEQENEGTSMRIIPENSYLISIGDDQYELYNEGKLVYVITEEMRISDFSDLKIQE